MASFQGVSWRRCRAKLGLFCPLYADRASHYWNTPEAGGKVDKDTPTQVGRALAQLGIELDPGLLARGKGALGAHVRHLAEAPAPGTQARRHHRHGRGQPLPQGGLPATTQRPLRDPGRGPGHRLRPAPSGGFCVRQIILSNHDGSHRLNLIDTMRYQLVWQFIGGAGPTVGREVRGRLRQPPMSSASSNTRHGYQLARLAWPRALKKSVDIRTPSSTADSIAI